MTAALKLEEDRRYTCEEFLDLLPQLEGKFELVDGRIVDRYLMAGAEEPHVLINSNLVRVIGNILVGSPCRVYGPDLLMRISKRSTYRIPDLSIVFGPTEFDKVDRGRRLAVTNPLLLLEILSESSQRDDRDVKFDEYRRIASLREYVLVSQRQMQVETFRRHEDGTWGIFAVAQGVDAIVELMTINARLNLRDIYANVNVPSEDPKHRPADAGDEASSIPTT